MKLKDYNKRRKLRFGGDLDPIPKWGNIRNKGRFTGQRVYQRPFSPTIPQTRLGNGLQTLNPLTDPMERLQKYSDVGQELNRRKNITTGIKSIRPKPVKPSFGKVVGKAAGRFAAPITIGVPTGIAIGEAITGEDLENNFNDWKSSRKNLSTAVDNRKAAERELAAIKKKYEDPNWEEDLENLSRFITDANMAGLGHSPATWSFIQEHSGVPSSDKEPPSNNLNNVEKKGGKGSSNNTKTSNSSTAYEFLDDSKIKRQSAPDVNLSYPDFSIDAQTVDVPSIKRPRFNQLHKKNIGAGIAEVGLQMLPDLINLGTGLFSKDDTLPKTKVSKAAVTNMPSRFNVNPQLEKNSASYRAILRDPNATMNQKLAALISKQRADSEVLTNKENIENQMEANKAALEANLDSQQASYDEGFRQDKMASNANLGLTGNFARSALASMSQKGLGMIAQKNREKQDNIALAAILAGVDEATRNRILEAIKNAK